MLLEFSMKPRAVDAVGQPHQKVEGDGAAVGKVDPLNSPPVRHPLHQRACVFMRILYGRHEVENVPESRRKVASLRARTRSGNNGTRTKSSGELPSRSFPSPLASSLRRQPIVYATESGGVVQFSARRGTNARRTTWRHASNPHDHNTHNAKQTKHGGKCCYNVYPQNSQLNGLCTLEAKRLSV